MTTVAPDPFDARRALGAPGLLGTFNECGVLAAADVHVAMRLATLGDGDPGGALGLAVALAVRAPRIGHVHVDLATIRETAAVESDEPVDLSTLPWPDPKEWLAAVESSPLVAVGEEGGAHPLRLLGSRLYLDRYWALERQLAADLRRAGQSPPGSVDVDVLAAGLARLFAGQEDSLQALAAACSVLARLGVVAGGPGTGKTTTVARIVGLIDEQATAAGLPPPLVALSAPTGKAAARLEQSVHAEARALDVSTATRERLLGLEATTLHRLLGWKPGSYSRFRHDRSQRLAHDLVIVDETSMVSLSLMARLAEAIRPDARLVLVGDPGQLASIEAGAVLGDIVGPAADGLRLRAGTRERLLEITGRLIDAAEPPAGAAIADGIVVLDRVHRYGAGIGRLATAIRHGDGDAVIDLLRQGRDEVLWIEVDVADTDSREALTPVRDAAVGAAATVVQAALAGRGRQAIEALGAFRILCAHRRGPQGVATWTARIESWLAELVPGFAAEEQWYPGRPLLVTENDYELRLFNGDSGVVVRAPQDRIAAVFERRGEIVELSPARLGAVQTVYAMTIHKSQGSQFDTAAVLLPAPSSPILTRELLYTAVTRARRQVILAGTEDTVRRAVQRPVARASGLRGRLWDEADPAP
ncbi:MAG TPA: exodeoxyribonuclease V subunit alpha [Solirubrobacteraceae bacterium]|nr:exodeoxyribonuclease V subunit alpha [Solirubrobacteraceae bacterium]